VNHWNPIKTNETIDSILLLHQAELGKHFDPYKNHVYRVYNLAIQQVTQPQDQKILSIAVAFHDLGIWTHHTFDYLPPSIALASNYCSERELGDDLTARIVSIISEHHRVNKVVDNHLTEAFRQADLTDLTFGLIKCGNNPAYIRLLKSIFPNKGFHIYLIKIFIKNLFIKPWKPLPMFKW
jgi:hypothetical protein